MPDSRVFLVTGASSGIGAATARQAASAGYKVVLAARTTERLTALADELGGLAVPTDVSSWEQNAELVATTLRAYRRLDVVFANAGFGAQPGWLQDTPERWRDMVLTNVLGTAYTVRAALPALIESVGHLVLNSSVAGRRALRGSLYSCTKASVTLMGEALRQEVNDTGVRVTVIQPGMVDTPFSDEPSVGGLEADDIASAVMFAVSRPRHVDVNEILVRPTAQRY